MLFRISFFATVLISLTSCSSEYRFESAPEKVLGQSADPNGGGVIVVETPVPPNSPTPTPTSTTGPVSGLRSESFTLSVSRNTPVDLLFVIDNSGSMEPSQGVLKNSFHSFIQKFNQRSIDYRVGIISTNVAGPEWWDDSENRWDFYEGYRNPGLGHLLSRYGGDPWLNGTDPQVESKFRDNANLGAHSGYPLSAEQGLASVLHALSNDRLRRSGANEGFIRPSALLSVIFVTDEDEALDDGESDPDRMIDKLIGRMIEVKGPTTPGYRFDFVVDLSTPKPATISYPLGNSVHRYPNVYLKAAERTGSGTYNIRTDFSADLLRIADSVVRQSTREFRLGKTPVESTLMVSIGGESFAPLGNRQDVKYIRARNSIEVSEALLKSANGKSIDVRYEAEKSVK